MTRETKIGLLVGLAFIIVIGILLSDHLTSATEPPSAHLAQAGGVVRQGVGTPASPAPPVTIVELPPATPQQPVPTHQEATPRKPPVQFVQIGPGGQQQPITIQPAPQQFLQPQQPQQSGQQQQQPAVIVQELPSVERQSPQATASQPPAQLPPSGSSASPLEQAARQHGEELVAVATGRPSETSTARQSPAPAAGAPMVPLGEYRAQEGDSVSRMASRLMGANTQANRDAIIKANPTLQADPNMVIAGRVYLVPLVSQARQAQPVAQAAPPPTPAAEPKPVPAVSEYWYTTKEGDNLWKIAAEQLGDGTAWTAIKELNKDKIGEGDSIRPGMKLRLPAPPLASAE